MDKAIEVIRELRVVDKKLLKSKFIALAKAKSISSSASKGGDMGWFGFADMPLEFSQVAFKMAVGTMMLMRKVRSSWATSPRTAPIS